MKRYRYILFAWFALMIGTLLVMPSVYANDFVDDVYYTPSQVFRQDSLPQNLQPIYDKNIREIIFLEDTTSKSDTIVRAIIRN